MSNEMIDTEYLVQALLAELKEDVEIHSYDELMIEEGSEVHDDQQKINNLQYEPNLFFNL